METVKHFLTQQFDGAPVWGWVVGFAILHLEWWLPRTGMFKANSLLEAVPNVLLAIGGRFVPGFSSVLAKLGTKEPTKKAKRK